MELKKNIPHALNLQSWLVASREPIVVSIRVGHPLRQLKVVSPVTGELLIKLRINGIHFSFSRVHREFWRYKELRQPI